MEEKQSNKGQKKKTTEKGKKSGKTGSFGERKNQEIERAEVGGWAKKKKTEETRARGRMQAAFFLGKG